MAKGVKIGKVNRKPGTLVYVTKTGDVMQMEPAKGRKAAPKKATKKKTATKKKVATKKKTVAKKATATKKKTKK